MAPRDFFSILVDLILLKAIFFSFSPFAAVKLLCSSIFCQKAATNSYLFGVAAASDSNGIEYKKFLNSGGNFFRETTTKTPFAI